MINVLIFGTGKSAVILESGLDIKNVNIVGYIDNNIRKQGELNNGKMIYSPNDINKLMYDYILIASQYNDEIYSQLIDLKVNKNNIFEYYPFCQLLWNEHEWSIKRFLNKDYIEVICTGISYALRGFKEDVCLKGASTFALGSQDIYYDYKITKYLLEAHKEKAKNIKYCLIGLSYYSFQYDLSLSAMKNKCLLYNNTLKDLHNYKITERIKTSYEVSNYIAEKLFRRREDGYYLFDWDLLTKDNYVINEIDTIGKNQAKLDCKKNFPVTVKENTEIFKVYLKLLKDNNIKPIVVVFPASKHYTKYFSKRIEDEFKDIINKVRKEYKFQYIDYFRTNFFEDEDFQDISHLNSKGAEKFTNILNEIIEW